MDELLYFINAIGINVKVSHFKSDAKGLMKGMPDGSLKIGLWKGLSNEDAMYTLAHELAHCYLHADKGDTINSEKHIEYEEQADRTARMLLDFIFVTKKPLRPTKVHKG